MKRKKQKKMEQNKKMAVYQNITNKICKKNKNKYENFTLMDKLIIKYIFEDVRKDTLNYLKTIANPLADVDLTKEILQLQDK